MAAARKMSVIGWWVAEERAKSWFQNFSGANEDQQIERVAPA